MTARHQNIIGTLAWIATRDQGMSDSLNVAWSKAKNKDPDAERMARIVIVYQLIQASSVHLLEKAKDSLCNACVDGKIGALARRTIDADIEDVPVAAWLDVEIDEVDGTIGSGTRPTWFGVSFMTSVLRRVWPAGAIIDSKAVKKKTGPRANRRDDIAGIMRQWELAAERANENGVDPPLRPTAKQIGAKLGMPERTVSHNLMRIYGKDGLHGGLAL